MSEELKSAREFAEAVAEWVQGGSPLDDVAVEHLTGVILSRDKLIEEAALRRAGEPWLFAIEQIDNGTWKDGEQCVFGDLVSAQDEVDLLNDAFPEGDNPYRVVPLFRSAISAPGALAAPQESMSKSDAQRCDDEGHKLIQVNCMCKIKVKPVAEHDREIERKARLAFYAEIMSLRCEPLGRLGMVQALKENKAAASTSFVVEDNESLEPLRQKQISGPQCKNCNAFTTYARVNTHGLCMKCELAAIQTKEGKEAQ